MKDYRAMDRAGSAPSPLLEFRLLGRFRVIDRSTDCEIQFRSRKALALLCYLTVARDRALTRERAMELLWGSRGEEQARASLRQILHEIRSSPVGQCNAIDFGRLHLSARAGTLETDVEQIISLAEAGSLPTLASRMTDCGERLFEGLDGIDPALDDWLRVERQQQLMQLNQAVVSTCALHKERDPSTARSVISALQRLNPCDETIARLGLELDHANGDLASLHQRYRWLEAALQRDLDCAPSDATAEMFRTLTKVAPIGAVRQDAVGAQDGPSAIIAPPAPGLKSGIEPPIIAVVGFDLFARSDEEEVLATILVNEIEYALSGLTDLRLLLVGEASRAALLSLSANSISAYALRGSLRINGDEILLGWKLSRVRDGLLLWTHRATVPRDGLGGALEGIVSRVAGAVLPTLERDFDAEPIDAAAGSAYGIYLKGRACTLSGRSIGDMREAAALFEQAIELSPRLVTAHLSLARLYNTDFEQHLAGHDRAAFRRRAFELCSRAVNLDPRNAHARARLGWCYMRRGDLLHARSQFEEALALNPYHADCLNEIGVAFCHMGELDRSMTLLSRAFELNPFPRDDYFCDVAVLLMLRGEHQRAEENFEIAQNEAFHYAAFRIANSALMGQVSNLAITDLRRRFRATWVRADTPSDGELIDAIFEYIPLQRPEHRERVAEGLSNAGLKRHRH